MNNSAVKTKVYKLRQKTEELLLHKPNNTSSNLNELEILNRIHELEEEKLELKLQNEELRLVKEKFEKSVEKYTQLYDFAPTAYFTLSKSGKIINVNHLGLKLLCNDRPQLLNYDFSNYVSFDARLIFDNFLINVFNSGNKETCEIKLAVKSESTTIAHLTGCLMEQKDQCLITIVDITELKKVAELNQILLTSLPYPAMYIRRADRVVLAANQIALDMGVKVGGQCWREFGKSEHISKQSKKNADNFPYNVPAKFGIQCTFCQADKCFSEHSEQNNKEINAFGLIWDTYWIKINEEVFLHYAVNITERKQAEEEREFLIASIENSSNIVVVKDLNLRVVAANKTYLKVSGHSSIKSIIGKNDAEIFGMSSDSEPIRSYIEDEKRAQKLSKGQYILTEELLTLPSGETRTVLTKKYPIFNKKGKLFCTGNLSLDITERKKAVEALQKNEEMLQNILEHFPGDIFWKDKNSNYLGCNQSFAEGAGLKSKNDVIYKNDFELEWEKDLAESYRADDLKIMMSGKEKLHRIEQKHQKNGEKIWFDTSKIPLRDSEGNIIGVLGVFTDITQRKMVEEALKQSEEKYRELIENSQDIIFMSNPKGILTYVSHAWTVLLGHPLELVVGKSFKEFIHPDDHQKYYKFMHKVITTGERQQGIEYRIEHMNGSWYWHTASGVPIRDEACEIIGFEGTATDITERKLAEEQLRESETKYRYLFANNPQPMWIIDYKTLKFLEVNQAAISHYGYSKEEFLNMTLKNIQLHKNSVTPFKKLNKDQNSYRLTIEEEHKKKDSDIITVEITTHLVNYEGKKARHILINDITERKRAENELKQLNEKLEDRVNERTAELSKSNISLQQAEEKFRTVADFTYGWEYWINDDGQILYMSPSAEKITGYALQEFLNDPHLIDNIVYINDRDNWENHKKSIYKSKKKKRHAEIVFRIEKKGGEIRWISSVCRCVTIDGKYMGMRVSNLNITKKVKAENDLLQVTVEVEERERNRFSRELHDGMGPLLSTIKLYFQWLSETDDPEKIKIITQKGNANIESAIQSTREIARGLSTQNLKKFGYVDTIKDFTERLNDTRKIAIVFNANTNERFGNFLETTLYRITTELIKNTVTYAEATTIMIDFVYIKEKNLIHFSYIDNGIGFDLASTEKGCKGMGVMNIQQRIKSLRGKIRIKTDIGKGMKVFIEFPIDDSMIWNNEIVH